MYIYIFHYYYYGFRLGLGFGVGGLGSVVYIYEKFKSFLKKQETVDRLEMLSGSQMKSMQTPHPTRFQVYNNKDTIIGWPSSMQCQLKNLF